MQKYHVQLTEEERQAVGKKLRSTKTGEQARRRGKVLVDLDEVEGKRQYTTKKISERLKVSEATISEVCKRYETGGVDAVFGRKKRAEPPVPAKVTGEVEAHIIATCCSAPPEGRARWTMQMIADKIVLDGIIGSISDETVRLVLKKRRSSLI